MKLIEKTENIQRLETQMDEVYAKILQGDRSPFANPRLFDLGFLANASDAEFYNIRKYFKNKLAEVNKQIELADDQELRELMLKITLYDQIRFEIKKAEGKFLPREK